jgi:NAD(P)H-hydrate epimerase
MPLELPPGALEPLATASEMRAAEERYPGYPASMAELMQRAGTAVGHLARRRFPEAHRFTVVCGSGSNGGDGRIAADWLRAGGADVTVVDATPEDEEKTLGDPDVIVDALFGTGFSGAPRPGAGRLIESMNAAGVPIVAVDVPSGVDASTGEIAGPAVRAAVTVTFQARKVGLVVAPGRFHAGDVVVADIGLPSFETASWAVTREILRAVPRRRPEQSKYGAGSVLVVGGSPGMTGAVCLTARAAFRADAGYVTIAAPRESLPVIETNVLEAVKRPLEEVWQARERAHALALGPGLGRSDDRRELVRRLLEDTDLPAVIDADALFELAPFQRDAATILTPHAGELGRLLGRESSEVDAHRIRSAREAADRVGCTVLLKGADTIVASPGEEGVLVSALGTAALATAGTGDVLTGVIAAFLAKGLRARTAAAAGAAAQQIASTLLPAQAGAVASDVVEALPAALFEG